jgi:hypothetical protein
VEPHAPAVLSVSLDPGPVIEVWKQDVDRTLREIAVSPPMGASPDLGNWSLPSNSRGTSSRFRRGAIIQMA